jgi:hypothetical protein
MCYGMYAYCRSGWVLLQRATLGDSGYPAAGINRVSAFQASSCSDTGIHALAWMGLVSCR